MNGWLYDMKELEGSTTRKDKDMVVLTIWVKNPIDVTISGDYLFQHCKHKRKIRAIVILLGIIQFIIHVYFNNKVKKKRVKSTVVLYMNSSGFDIGVYLRLFFVTYSLKIHLEAIAA